MCTCTSTGVAKGGSLWLSWDGDRQLASISEQTCHLLSQIEAQLTFHGYSWSHVVLVYLYLYSMADYPTVNSIYSNYFPSQPPARWVFDVVQQNSKDVLGQATLSLVKRLIGVSVSEPHICSFNGSSSDCLSVSLSIRTTYCCSCAEVASWRPCHLESMCIVSEWTFVPTMVSITLVTSIRLSSVCSSVDVGSVDERRKGYVFNLVITYHSLKCIAA